MAAPTNNTGRLSFAAAVRQHLPNAKESKEEENLADLLNGKLKISSGFDMKRVHIIQQAHKDDIHGIISVGNDFITGSKDGSLKRWSFKGTTPTCKVIDNPPYIDYRNWITALAPLSNGCWLSATRNGNVTYWNENGGYQDLDVRHGPFPTDPKCKQRNTNRINCLAHFEFDHYQAPQFIAGWPTQFTVHSLNQRLKYIHTCVNDWVYVVEPIDAFNLLVVTGCRLDLYARRTFRDPWFLSQRYIQEDKSVRVNVRPFISALTKIKHQTALYGLAVFDGSVQLYDIEKKAVIFRGDEHQNRVWTIENVRRDCFASCADDGFVKLWDLRQKSAVQTKRDIEGISARVSIIKMIDENHLLSGACPDDVYHTTTKAQLSIWDLRKE